MYLNTIKPAEGARKCGKRVGRGIGSGVGKTCGRGHKGQHSRAGGSHKAGFEGGQMPLQRRLPKFGFNSRKGKVTTEIRLDQLSTASESDRVVDMQALRDANLISANIKFVKVIGSGKLTKAITLKGIKATAGAKTAIVDAGGKVEE